MTNINELIFRVNNNLRNKVEINKQDARELLKIAMTMEKQLSIPRVCGQSEQIKAFAKYAQKRILEDASKDLSELLDEFLNQ